uniref:Uncharacterized protein MANES_01G074500 n=1 Tax=Rhizophora mucronata TaxID=61149 RepID=A0A2P2L467_RHIMU
MDGLDLHCCTNSFSSLSFAASIFALLSKIEREMKLKEIS